MPWIGTALTLTLMSCSTTRWDTVTPRGFVDYSKSGRPIPIMSRGRAGAGDLSAFLLERNKKADRNTVLTLARTYIREAAAEGVNHDVAFCQMCLETNYLKFGGSVRVQQNNFCGLGATGGNVTGAHFKNMQVGVRAHIQHLKAYAGTGRLHHKIADPRFSRVKRGIAPTVQDLAGTWAADPEYGLKIAVKLKRLQERIR